MDLTPILDAVDFTAIAIFLIENAVQLLFVALIVPAYRFIRAKAGEQNAALLDFLANQAVSFAQQAYRGLDGAGRKREALAALESLLSQHKVKINAEAINAALEAAVLRNAALFAAADEIKGANPGPDTSGEEDEVDASNYPGPENHPDAGLADRIVVSFPEADPAA